MKNNMITGSLFVMLAAAGTMAACNDFDGINVPYDTEAETPFTPSPPSIDASWNLQLIDNIGQHDQNVYVYKDKKYDALFTRTLGWNGGDGVFTTGLPDGNVFWSFNDSFYGVADAATRARGNTNFPRNTLMIQKGSVSGGNVTLGETDADLVWLADFVQTTDPDAERYYQARTHLRNPDATMSDAEIAAGFIDQDYVYWAGDGTVYDHPVHGKIYQMTWGAVHTPGNGNMFRYRTALAQYSLQGEPGDGTYMSLLSVDHNFIDEPGFDATSGGDAGYGSTLFEDEDGHIYLYTNEQDGSLSRMLVARTETLDLGSTWSYYIRDLNGDFQWQTTYPTAEERGRSYIQTETGTLPWVFKSNGSYYMIFQSFPYGRAILISRSDKPYGPFTEQKLLFTLPGTLDKLGDPHHMHWYMINLHPALSRVGELVFSTNSEAYKFGDNFNYTGSADFYRPYFFRVFNWESLYEEEPED